MGHIVTISGDLGSGKTSVSRVLSTKLGYKYVCSGSMHRTIAEEMRMNLLEFNLYAESDPSIDDRIDSALITLANEGASYVIESRVAWHLLKNSLKVYLVVDPDVGAMRVMSDMNRLNEPLYLNHADTKAQLRARKESENRRFVREYGVDCSDLRNYDVVIDSTSSTSGQVVDQLWSIATSWRDHKNL
ncbi:MAG: cytidylate kinase family protein [Candidatus Sulfotelmatobacter sp.]